MGTRSLTKFYETDGTEIVTMYRQMDGYFSEHGKDLAEFLAPFKIVNGYSMDQKARTHANGGGCLAAQVIEHFKHQFGIGGIYLHAAGTTDCGEEFTYHVKPKSDGSILIEAEGDGKKVKGTPAKLFAKWSK